MAVNSESGDTIVRLWLLLHRVRDMLVRCEDSMLSAYGLTVEQCGLLGSVKARGGSLRPVDLAQILERSPNSVSMLVDRMVRAGLVRRTRDRKDRRVVNVSLTSKGERALEPAAPAGWELIQEVLSSLSVEDRLALASMLERIKCDLQGRLNPEAHMADLIGDSITNQPGLYETMVKNVLPAGTKAKRQSGRRKKGS